ncbi:hypothetical protein ONA92_24110 [Mycobacteroides salmoniphilum]|uniref:hypothetical protein n=1 Tax=Mycobacteroides salmoniphilum TaxID=404941 RepID=UPI00356506EA
MSQYLTLDIIGRSGTPWRVLGPGRGQRHIILSPKCMPIFDLPVETRWVTNSFGQRYQDYRFKKHTFPLTFISYHCDKYTWANVMTEFGWEFDFDGETILRFTGPDGVRDKFVRKESNSTAFQTMQWEGRDPFLTGAGSEQFTLSAELPFYVGKPVVQELHAEGTRGWFEFDFINEGDVPDWGRWTLTDQADWEVPDSSWGSPMLGRPDEDYGRTVPIPAIDIRDGGLEADSDPRQQTLISEKATLVQGRWKGLDLRYPLPAGLNEKATVRFTNNTNPDGAHCRLTIPQWYSRPMSRPFKLAR